MDAAEYKRRMEVQQQKLKRKREEQHEHNVKAVETHKKEVIEIRMLALFGMAPPEKKQRSEHTERAIDQIMSIRDDEKAGLIDGDHADEQRQLLRFASYADICRSLEKV